MSEDSILKQFTDDQEFQLVGDLIESRLFRNDRSGKKFTAKDITDLAFLYLLSIEILANEFDFASKAIAYARGTARYNGFDTFKRQSTDLYLLLHYASGKGSLNQLKKTKNNDVHMGRVDLDTAGIIRYLRNIAGNRMDGNYTRRLFMRLEKDLNITTGSYKHLRRLVIDWTDLNRTEKELVITRLLMALRHRARHGEILPYMEKFAKMKRLELKKGVTNPETGQGTSNWKSKALGAAAAIGAGYLGYKAGRAMVGEDVNPGNTEYGVVADTNVQENDPDNEIEPDYEDEILKDYNARHDTSAPEKDAEEDREKIANELMSRMKSKLSGDDAMYGPYSAQINDLVQDVSHDLEYDVIDVVRSFTAVYGHEPVMWFEIENNGAEQNYEFATKDDVEGDLTVFDDAAEYDDNDEVESVRYFVDDEEVTSTDSLEEQFSTIAETMAGCVAGAATALGAGDPEASIYYHMESPKPKKNKKKKSKKVTMIRR